MGVLNFIAGLAAVILTLELLVLTILIAAICVGVWYGLRFAERKAHPLFDKVNGYVEMARNYEHRGLRLLVKPVIVAHACGEQIGVTISSLLEQARRSP
jgi:hypothetical protein